jgi:hypothetical protein
MMWWSAGATYELYYVDEAWKRTEKKFEWGGILCTPSVPQMQKDGKIYWKAVVFNSKHIILLTSEFMRYWVVAIHMALNLEPQMLYSTMNIVLSSKLTN